MSISCVKFRVKNPHEIDKFIGRDEELGSLKNLFKKRSGSLIVIRGRRRIGKSRLIQEFGRSAPCHVISGRPPHPDETQQDQINIFLEQVAEAFKTPQLEATTWHQALWLLSQQCQKGRMIVALDEISWMASKDKYFLGDLKNAWDLQLSRNPQLVVILCGSVSHWIEENILMSTGFVGRISLDIQLKELPLCDAVKFWDSRRNRIDSYEIFKILSVTGGVPRYLEEIQPENSAGANIERLCFNARGLLFREYEQIFTELFDRKAHLYTKILEALSSGTKSIDTLCKALDIHRGGWLTESLRTLLAAGFIRRHPTWDLQSKRRSRFTQYRLSDNYVRFYLRCIAPNREEIQAGLFDAVPGWSGIMGLQFENLVLNNQLDILRILNIKRSDVLRLGPYFQRKTSRKKGCQVDLLVQTRTRSLYLCEIKYAQDRIGMAVVPEIEEKQALLAMKGWSIHTVLIHVNGITEELRHSQAIDHFIDFSQLLEA